ncbi:helix-turn-helix domain-containing protein [Actinophytocola sediminis]
MRSRELGEGLRRIMERRGLHASGIARELNWSPSRVSRVLSGKRGGSSHDVAAFMAVCGAGGDEREQFMALSHDHRPNWHLHHDPALPKHAPTLSDHEQHATQISTYHNNTIPDLLQTTAYATALLHTNPTVPRWHVTDRVTALRERQHILDNDQPPDCVFLIHEFVLHTPVGNTEIMSNQVHALLRWSIRPAITIRIVPRTVGVTGPFTLLHIRDYKQIAHLDAETTSHFIETPTEINTYRTLFRHLTTNALDEHQSRQLVTTFARTLTSGPPR